MYKISFKLLLFLSLCLIGSQAFAVDPYECIVISGLKHDWNGAIKRNNPIMQTTTIRGKACKSFDSWKEANLYLGKTKSKKILFFQGTHGGSGGTAVCNSQEENATDILESLEKLNTRGVKVGYLSMSCYSGDLLKKLIALQTIGNPSSKLCVITDSYIDRTSRNRAMMSSHALELVPAGSSLNDVFKRMNAGMTSAAPWSESGLDYKFANDTFLDPNASLNVLDIYSDLCPEKYIQEFYQYSKTESETETRNLVTKFLGNVTKKGTISRANFDPLKLGDFLSNLPENKECMTKIYENLKVALFGDRNEANILDVLKAPGKFITPQGCDDVKFSQELAQESQLNVDKKFPMILFSSSQIELTFDQMLNASFPVLEGGLDRLDIMMAKYAYDDIKQKYKIDLNSPELANLAFLKGAPEVDKAALMNKLISERGSDTLNPLDAFMKGSMYTQPKNPKDLIRWKACEDFKL